MKPTPADGPAGPSWDCPLEEAELVFVDLEMTGLRADKDRVIEVCAERVRGSAVLSRFDSLVRPDPLCIGNVHVHGICSDDLVHANTFADVAQPLEAVLSGAVFVAHAAKWDIAFLEAEFSRLNHPFGVLHFLDTLALARRAFGFSCNKLSALCEAFGIPRRRMHRASDDVAALREVFARVVAELKPTTARDLWHARIGEKHARPEVMAVAAEALEKGVSVRVRYRPSGRAAEQFILHVVAIRTELDPPRLLGYLLPSRSRRELRADRILTIQLVDSASETS